MTRVACGRQTFDTNPTSPGVAGAGSLAPAAGALFITASSIACIILDSSWRKAAKASPLADWRVAGVPAARHAPLACATVLLGCFNLVRRGCEKK